MMRTLTKLVTNAKNAGHSSMRPWDSETPLPAGSRRFNASSVIANAKTPSRNASRRTVSSSSSASRFMMRLGLARHASGRFEGASRKAKQAFLRGLLGNRSAPPEDPDARRTRDLSLAMQANLVFVRFGDASME